MARPAATRDVILSAGYETAGEDFAEALMQSKGDPVAALSRWAAMLEDYASSLRRVADVLKGSGVTSVNATDRQVEVHDVPGPLIPALMATGIVSCGDVGAEDHESEEA